MIKKSSKYELTLQLSGGIPQSQYVKAYDFNCHAALGTVKGRELHLRFPYIKLKSSKNYTPGKGWKFKKSSYGDDKSSRKFI